MDTPVNDIQEGSLASFLQQVRVEGDPGTHGEYITSVIQHARAEHDVIFAERSTLYHDLAAKNLVFIDHKNCVQRCAGLTTMFYHMCIH